MFLDERQSQAGALGLPFGICSISPMEPPEDGNAFRRRDAGTAVIDMHDEIITVAFQLYGCHSKAVSLGVLDEIGEHTLESHFIE